MKLKKKLFQIYPNSNPRLVFFYGVLALGLVILVGGLAWRQLIQGAEYRAREKRQNQRRILHPAPRGDILDRNGVLLAGTRPHYTAVIHLNELRSAFREEYIIRVRQARQSRATQSHSALQNSARGAVVQRYLDQINVLLGRSETINLRRLRRHFSWKLLLPFPLIQDLESKEYALLTEHLPIDSPIELYATGVRYYPYGPSASHTLGYVVSTEDISQEGVPGDDLRTFRFKGKTGKTGLERFFEANLLGLSGGEIWVVDPVGFQYDKPLQQQPPRKGNDLHISLDIELQRIAEAALGDKTGAIVALEVTTGKLLALVSKPDYDLNDFSPYISPETIQAINERGAWLNRATQGLYPPGSVFKVIVALAALRHGVTDFEESIYCAGSHRVGNLIFPCHHALGHGDVTLKEALIQSCNIYFYQIGLRTGVRAISAEARRFGLDQPTGIELPFEATGMIVPDPQWKQSRRREPWRPGDTANLSIGQGFLLVTPLQIATFMASLARGDTLSRPTLMNADAPLPPDHRTSGTLGLPPSDYALLIEALKQVVETGTGRLARIQGLPIVAKTGTAQVRSKGHKLTLGWFAGFAPADEPQIALCVMIEGTDPDDNFSGGRTAGPIAKIILKKYFAQQQFKSRLASLSVPSH